MTSLMQEVEMLIELLILEKEEILKKMREINFGKLEEYLTNVLAN